MVTAEQLYGVLKDTLEWGKDPVHYTLPDQVVWNLPFTGEEPAVYSHIAEFVDELADSISHGFPESRRISTIQAYELLGKLCAAYESGSEASMIEVFETVVVPITGPFSGSFGISQPIGCFTLLLNLFKRR